MKRLDERNADFFEKLAIGLFVGALVGDTPGYAKAFLVAGAVLCYGAMTLITARAQDKEDDDGHGDRP